YLLYWNGLEVLKLRPTLQTPPGPILTFVFLLHLNLILTDEPRDRDGSRHFSDGSVSIFSKLPSSKHHPNFSDQTHHVYSLERNRRLSRASSVLSINLSPFSFSILVSLQLPQPFKTFSQLLHLELRTMCLASTTSLQVTFCFSKPSHYRFKK
ncbi:hypothetical protein IGI04_037507, partial [Brassica rapa subsp. trilocularis]